MPTVLRVFGGVSLEIHHRAGNALTKVISSARGFILSRRQPCCLPGRGERSRRWQRQSTGKLVSVFRRTSSWGASRLRETRTENQREDICRRFVFHRAATGGARRSIRDDSPGGSRHCPDGFAVSTSLGHLMSTQRRPLERRERWPGPLPGFPRHDQVEAALCGNTIVSFCPPPPAQKLPGVIAEAFAPGLPVITTRWLAIPRIVDETCGILIEPENTAAFVAALTALPRQPSLATTESGRAGPRLHSSTSQIWSKSSKRSRNAWSN